VRHASLWLDITVLFYAFWIVLAGDRGNESRLAAALAQAAKGTPQEWDVAIRNFGPGSGARTAGRPATTVSSDPILSRA
jgi:hypothetical protein